MCGCECRYLAMHEKSQIFLSFGRKKNDFSIRNIVHSITTIKIADNRSDLLEKWLAHSKKKNYEITSREF